MRRQVNLLISYCNECPYSLTNDNEMGCKYKSVDLARFIGTYKVIIEDKNTLQYKMFLPPEWCPLPVVQEDSDKDDLTNRRIKVRYENVDGST